MEYLSIDGKRFYNMIINASNRLEEQKDYVNSLNVFPVPDGDTGTNMSMTFTAAVSEIENIKSDSVGEISKKLAKGALMGARGNSGVILSQIFRGISKALEGKDEVTAQDLAQGLVEGSKSAYKAVMRPTEGTILTIIRAAGESAVKCNETNVMLLMKEVCEHAEYMLDRTPEMLPVLKKAKVVDSGGMGLLIILKGMYEVLNKDIQSVNIKPSSDTVNYTPAGNISTEEIEFGYCTEFIILSKNGNADKLKKEIEPLGDSMIVVGVEDIIKVHIHSNDPGMVLSKAVQHGELTKVKIENMREQHRHLVVDEPAEAKDEEIVTKEEETKKYGIIAVAMGEGIKNIFKDLGVDCVIEGGQTMNPSTQDILECVNKVNADNIIVLPNNKNIIMAATQAAEIAEKNVIVVPTKTIPQGISSVTVFNPDGELEDNIEEMKQAISKVLTGSVTYAVRDTEMDGQMIKEGNILGLSEGKISEVGMDSYEVCEKLIRKMATKDSELITVYFGKDCSEAKVEEMISRIENDFTDADIQCYNGEQPLYYFLISVE